MSPYEAAFKKEEEFEYAFSKAGGLLLAGLDPTGMGGVIAGFGDQREVELLVEAGFTPVEAIHIATYNGAQYLGDLDRIGTIAAGKQADLVVIKGDPSKKIEDIENVETVFKDGVGYDSEKLIEYRVLGADTIVVVDGAILGKPRDAADAACGCSRLLGRTHEVITRCVVAWWKRARPVSGAARPFEITLVSMIRVVGRDSGIRRDGGADGQGGAYAIQGMASRWIPRIEGDYSNVVGLPVALVYDMLRKGIRIFFSSSGLAVSFFSGGLGFFHGGSCGCLRPGLANGGEFAGAEDQQSDANNQNKM